MTDDQIIREVREARAELSKQCGRDLRRFGEMMRERQRASGREYVSPRRPARSAETPE